MPSSVKSINSRDTRLCTRHIRRKISHVWFFVVLFSVLPYSLLKSSRNKTYRYLWFVWPVDILMDSSGSSLSSLTTTEASQLLKDILNVGKARVGPAGG